MCAKMPRPPDLLDLLFQALRRLGGSGSNQEIYDSVVDSLQLPESILNKPHHPERAGQNELQYRLGWAKTWLKHYGVIVNSERGVWAIAPDSRNVTEVDPREVERVVQRMMRQRRKPEGGDSESEDNGRPAADTERQEVWKEELLGLLTTELQPDGFERLSQRLLREWGFMQVQVTGRSGDGGIDGKGIYQVGGLLSFHVVFQCKRYRGSVSAGAIRDFRGAMIGRADKGLFITTGSFTRDAIREATRDGAPPLDLVDGDQLAEMLKQLNLGVKTETVEQVSVDADWFRSI